jgi:signal transduction histidine kinase/ActR/RegA family two-component response regulator
LFTRQSPTAVALAPSAVMGFLPIPGIIVSAAGDIVSGNLRAAELVGLPLEDLVGSAVWAFVPAVRVVWEALWRAIRATRHVEIDLELPVSPRGPRHLRVSAVLVHDREVALALCVIVDLTERRGADLASRDEEARRASQRQLDSVGRLAGGIAHEFNNHLVGVLAEASVAQEDVNLSPEARAALRRIEAAALRMSEQTRQLLAYAGRGRFITERLDPDILLDECGEQLRARLPRHARLVLGGGGGRAVVEADPGLLRQVIENLIANAGEALRPSGGVVTVGTTFADGKWTLTVADDGVGMDGPTQARVFDPFFSTKRDGHGLGLSAVQGIVTRIGGTVEVASVVGEGTTFTVMLPATAAAPAPEVTDGSDGPPARARTPSRPVRAGPLTDLRVLVADDEPTVRATVCRLLERRGATVVAAGDGVDAIALLDDGAFGLIVLDVSMPGCGGYDVLPVARARHPGAAVLMMSGYTEAYKAPRGAPTAEADGFIAKPFTAREFDAAIDQALGASRAKPQP